MPKITARTPCRSTRPRADVASSAVSVSCAPAGAAKRCLDGCQAKDRCPYDAEKIYITNEKTGVAQGKTGWPCDVLTLHPTEASIRQAIQEGP